LKKKEVQGDSTFAVHNFKKAYDSFKREILYSILIEFGVHMELIRLLETCLKDT
jgi:hypothetical protein